MRGRNTRQGVWVPVHEDILLGVVLPELGQDL